MNDLPPDLLNTILQTVADGIVVHDATGRLRFANDMAARLSGYASGEAFVDAPAGEALSRFELLDERGEILSPELLPGRRALRGEGASEITVRYRGHDAGDEHWSILAASPISDAQGNVEFVVSSFRDVTAEALTRSRAQEAALRQAFLADASRQLSSSLDYEATLAAVARLAVVQMADWCTVDILDEDGRVRRLAVAHADPAKLAYAEELAQRYPLEKYPPRVLSTGQSELYPYLTDEMLAPLELEEDVLQIIRDLGLQSAMTVPLIAHGRIFGALTFVAAESGRRYTPEDLALAEELASRAAIAVENARLYQQALHALDVRNDFLAVAAHELKTPLTSLRLSAELFLRTQAGEPRTAFALATRIVEQSGRLGRLIEQLLDVSRIETGRLQVSPQWTNLADLVRETVDALPRSADDHAISVRAESAVYAMVDWVRMEQVLVNLLENARKFSPPFTSIEVTVAQPTPEDARISVRDHGSGIPEEHRPHIFERFYEVDPTRASSGLGLGLFISQQIVELHGGEIVAEFPPDGGTRFVVRLPSAPPAAAPVAKRVG
jgi:PAS domain S-box-containing protein